MRILAFCGLRVDMLVTLISLSALFPTDEEDRMAAYQKPDHQLKALQAQRQSSHLGDGVVTIHKPTTDVDSQLRIQDSLPSLPVELQKNSPLPELSITCFGCFEVRQSGQPLVLCPNRNAQAILRYLVAQANYSAPAEKLVAMAWPDDEPEVAQNKLHIAISALRRSLHAGLPSRSGAGYLMYKSRIYFLNPAVPIRTDAGEFLHWYQAGQENVAERVAFYERACRLYTGPFLLEDLYADWSFLLREQFKQRYLTMCRALATHYLDLQSYEEAARWSTMILSQDPCDEAAHRQLMQISAAQGYRSQAIRQYHHCERILRQELGVRPSLATVQFFQTLLRDDIFPS